MLSVPRLVNSQYRDPAGELWLETARRIGLQIQTDDTCFASTDGKGTLRLSPEEHLDKDDCLAQMIFHELCHSLIAGPDGFSQADWGLKADDLTIEYACLTLQGFLASQYGLRKILAPTTEHREFYDNLPPLFFASPQTSEATVLAIAGYQRVTHPPWGPFLTQALESTALIASAVASHAPETSLWRRFHGVPAKHPLGAAEAEVGAEAGAGAATCGECGWWREGTCQRYDSATCDSSWPACVFFERGLDCLKCGACCRAAYHSVEVEASDPFLDSHRDQTVTRENFIELKRVGTKDNSRCAMLPSPAPPFACSAYEDRPQTCRDFEKAGQHCLTARRRLHISP